MAWSLWGWLREFEEPLFSGLITSADLTLQMELHGAGPPWMATVVWMIARKYLVTWEYSVTRARHGNIPHD
ncbi:MAG: hypothetical protein FWD68_04965 [Alphaproteobacteria bacterium]|nr:hypothetical protein [Alphaproteobacteria bacterium]